MKFLPGDKILVVTKGKIGTVLDVGLDMGSKVFNYKVIWEDLEEYGKIEFKSQSEIGTWELFEQPYRNQDGTIKIKGYSRPWRYYFAKVEAQWDHLHINMEVMGIHQRKHAE